MEGINNPIISVIMPTYNTPREMLETAINSILEQTFQNYEFIIIDDCSTDGAYEYLCAIPDERIKVIRNNVNLGITASLNVGLATATGKYIARMDSDDIALPERFSKQLEFMENNPDVVVCGTWYETFGDKHYIVKKRLPQRDYLQCSFLFGNTYGICHPSAFFRGDVLRDNNILYDTNLPVAQDYGMWCECVKYGTIVNLEEILMKYRIFSGQVSSAKRSLQIECATNVKKKYLEQLLDNLNEKDLKKHSEFCENYYYMEEMGVWIKQLKKANEKKEVYNIKVFNAVANDFLKLRVKNSAKRVRSIKKLIRLLKNSPINIHWEIWFTLSRRIINRRTLDACKKSGN